MEMDIIEGSGNVFEDLGLANSDEDRIKVQIAMEIIKIVEKRKLSQKDAAKAIGASQPDISNLKNAKLNGFTLDRLFHFLMMLNRDIEISIKRVPRKSREGRIAIAA